MTNEVMFVLILRNHSSSLIGGKRNYSQNLRTNRRESSIKTLGEMDSLFLKTIFTHLEHITWTSRRTWLEETWRIITNSSKKLEFSEIRRDDKKSLLKGGDLIMEPKKSDPRVLWDWNTLHARNLARTHCAISANNTLWSEATQDQYIHSTPRTIERI